MKLIKLLLVSTFVFFASSWALAQEDSGQDYEILLDKFVVDGPGAGEPGWFDDFNDGDLSNWSCHIGTCQDEPGTSFARLGSPGRISPWWGGSFVERSDMGSWNIWQTRVSPDGWFQGLAIFAAELAETDVSTHLSLHYLIDDNGRMLNGIATVVIYNPSDEISVMVDGVFPGGLRVYQFHHVYDEDWNGVGFSNYELELITAPEVLGNIILSIRFEDGPEGPVFHAGYSLTEIPVVLEPFTPIPADIHTTEHPTTGWAIGGALHSIGASPVIIDIKPGSDPNCFNINGHGVIPVAILGTDTFDVSNIDQSTLSFGGLGVRIRGNKWPFCGLEDTNGDGVFDLVCQFQDNTDNWSTGDSDDATLTGELLDGTPFEGSDSICVVP